jgi:hypothetical protein
MGTAVLRSTVKKSVISLALLALMPSSAMADKTDDIVNRGVARMKSGAASQKRIDDISEKTDKIISQYHQQRKVVEGLKIYNDRLRRTLTAQQVAMGKLTQSIEDASLIERQIVPLMLRMIDGLEKFVAADLPFKMAERTARLDRIKGYLTNANISAAERFRQVLDAYSTENNYGTTIAVYTDSLPLGDEELTVNVLQVGRTGLYYQTLDAQRSGYWDISGRTWVDLDSSHNEGILNAIRITQGKETKNLMELPLAAPVMAQGGS